MWDQNLRVYGAEKVWKQLNREGVAVARVTVERLMREMGLEGVVRGRTTVPHDAAARPMDLVDRDFTAQRRNRLWASALTYLATWRGLVYVAFVVDAFSRRIVGRRASSPFRSGLALDALEQAIWERQDASTVGLIQHSDLGVQYLSIRFTERLTEAGIEPSVGSRGDSHDNAVAETFIGLYMTEVIRRRGLDDVEFATLEWVWWFNHHRPLSSIGHVPPVEYEEEFNSHYVPRRGEVALT